MVDIPDYYARAYSLLASQFQVTNPDGSLTNFQKMIYAISTMSQLIQTQLNLLQTDRFLDFAQGVQLDGIGQILGLARVPGQPDDSGFVDGVYQQGYRQDLQFQIFVNESEGTPEDVITILKYLTNASTVWYDDMFPAAYILTTNGLTFPANPSDLNGIMQSVSPAGVQYVGTVATYGGVPFVFSSDPFEEQLYVAANPDSPGTLSPFQADPGTGIQNFFVQAGMTSNPDFGGGFAEAILIGGDDYDYDDSGAGQLSEFLATNGNIPPPY